jgi:hypothetical protein
MRTLGRFTSRGNHPPSIGLVAVSSANRAMANLSSLSDMMPDGGDLATGVTGNSFRTDR